MCAQSLVTARTGSMFDGLDFCSEMLSIVGKITALYTQKFDDDVAIASVNELEALSTGLTRKIWQKLMILHSFKAALDHVVTDSQ